MSRSDRPTISRKATQSVAFPRERETRVNCPPPPNEPCAHEQHLKLFIKQIATGDEQAFAALYDATSPLVFGLVRRILGDTFAAETVLCEVYESVWREASEYESGRSAPLTWLIEVARRRALKELYAGKHGNISDWSNDGSRGMRSEEHISASPSERQRAASGHLDNCAVIAEREKATRTVIDALLPDERQVLELAYFSGLRQSEIAVRLKLPVSAVKTRMRGALGKLRDQHSRSNWRLNRAPRVSQR